MIPSRTVPAGMAPRNVLLKKNQVGTVEGGSAIFILCKREFNRAHRRTENEREEEQEREGRRGTGRDRE